MVWSFLFSSGGSFAFPPAEDRQDEHERADEDEGVVACCTQYYEGNRAHDLEEEDDRHGQLAAIAAAAFLFMLIHVRRFLFLSGVITKARPSLPLLEGPERSWYLAFDSVQVFEKPGKPTSIEHA
jgi:hypothetical protein